MINDRVFESTDDSTSNKHANDFGASQSFHSTSRIPNSIESRSQSVDLQQPQLRDRAQSIDGHILRSMITLGSDSAARGIYSMASSPLINSMSSSRAASHSPLSNLSPSPSPRSLAQPGTPSRKNGLLYSLLVSTDPHTTSGRNKKPFAPTTTNTLATSEAKKYKFEESTHNRMLSGPVGARRFSFSGSPAPRSERIKAILRGNNGTATIPTLFKPMINHCIKEFNLKTHSGEFAFPTISTSTQSILSALIASPGSMSSPGLSSTSTDSGLDEPLDLTGCSAGMLKSYSASVVEGVQLAKKTARPVQARISEWFRLAAEFVQSKSQNSILWISKFRAVWHRLLLLSMAEHALDIVTVESPHASEHLSADKPVLPWLLISTDSSQFVPTKEFANQVVQCLHELREQKLSAKEFDVLRHAVLLTADHPVALPTLGLKMVEVSRSDRVSAGNQPPTTTTTQILSHLNQGIQILADICPFKFAGLFCCHLRGEASRSVLPLDLRQESPSLSNVGESILGSLICDAPQSASSSPRSHILVSGTNYTGNTS